jgi:hypothetical protein
MIKMSLGGINTKVLVDSGTQISCINERFLNATSFRNYKANKSMVKSIIGAEGINHVVKGQINLPLNFDGKVIYQYFQIIPELRNSLILGMDFLKANQALINIGQKELILNNKEKTKIPLVKKDVGCIRISSKIRIPPQSTNYIPVKLSNVNKHECTGQTS